MISVVICSHNGANTLTTTLEALASTRWPPQRTEIIVVDNASTDGSDALIPHEIGGQTVTKLYEARKGKSFALNAAIRQSTGNYVAFLDDDIRVSPDWLLAYADAINTYPEATVFCGQLRPDFEVAPPAWLVHLCDSGRAFGTTPKNLNAKTQEIKFSAAKGGNMMIRSAELKSVLFDETHFNYTKGGMGGEDTFLVKMLTDNLHPPLFVPNALGYHRISKEEATLGNLSQRYERIGYMVQSRDVVDLAQERPQFQNVLRRYLRRIARRRFSRMVATLLGDQKKAADLTLDIAIMAGQIEFLKKQLNHY